MNTSEPARYKDFKWVTGIIAFILLALALLLFVPFRLTSKTVAVNIGSTVVAHMFSPQGLDEPGDIETLKNRIPPGQAIQPIPNLPITLQREEIENLSPREIRLRIFRQIVEPLYEGGEELEKFAGRTFSREELAQQYGLLVLFSRRSHEIIARPFWIISILALLSFLPLVYFSRRWGRVVSPALVLGLASFPWIIFFIILRIIASQALANPGEGAPSLGLVAGRVAHDVLPAVAWELVRPALILMSLSIVLFVIAAIGKITTRQKTKT